MLSQIKYEKENNLETIGNIIPKGKVTLLHGRSGCGKSYGIIKYMEEVGIEPVFIDFDNNDEYNTMKIVHTDGYKLIDWMIDNEDNMQELYNDFKDKVVIIDTYAMAKNYIATKMENRMTVEDLVKKFEEIGCTTIVIAHTTYYSMKPAEPDVDTVFANHVACRLHLFKNITKKATDIYLVIEKLRGYKGEDKIIDWMR